MKSHLAWKLAGSCCVVMGLVLATGGRALAVEQVREFIEKLKERGYYDYALEYMQRMKENPLAPEDFRKNYLLEYGTLLVDTAKNTADTKVRDQLFTEARDTLSEYATNYTGTLEGAMANTQLATLLVERGRATVRKAELPTQQANKEKLLAEAREMFDGARKGYESVNEYYTTALQDKVMFPPSLDQKTDPQKFALRQQYRGELVEARLLTATTAYEKAKTYDADSEDAKKLFTEAAEQYGQMYESYRQWLGGLYARLYQGRCYQDMKDYKMAVAYYEDLLSQDPNEPVFRTLIAKTYVQLGECLLEQKKYDELINRCTEWVNGARGVESKHADWIAVRYQLALAHHEAAEMLTDPKDEGLKNRHLKAARELAYAVSRIPCEWQKPAQELLGKLGRVVAGGGDELKTFDDAFEKGKNAVEMMVAKKALLDGGAIAKNNPEQVEQTKQEIVDARDEAFRAFRVALSLVDEDVEVDKVNLVRYYLCYLNWEMQHFPDAAVLGVFLAHRYPDSTGARPAAKIAMASFLQMYNDPANVKKDWEAQQLIDLAEFIVKRWQGQQEADDAYNMLISFMVQQHKVVKAQQYLANLSTEYAGRGKAELKVGQALWSEYIRGMKASDDERPPQADLDEMKQKAQSTLEEGVQRMREGGGVSDTLANAMLSLAQIYLDTGQYDKAVATLEDEQFGPLTLLAANNDTVTREGYPEAAYKAALRAYVTVNPPKLEEAETVMDNLEKLVSVGGDAGAQEKLTMIFISLGLQLQDQIQAYRGENKQAEIDALAKSFEVFLERIRAREQGNTWASRNWVASTYYNLGTGFEDGKKLSDRGKDYYTKAVTAYDQILDEVAKKKLEAPSENAVLSVEMRTAECERKLGKYREALDRLAEILAKKPMMLDAQIAAAYTYQERGQQEKSSWLYYAYMGGRKDKKTNKNRIWGWAKLGNVTAPHKQYRSVFHEARYNQALCRFEYGKSQASAADQQKLYKLASNDIRVTSKLYPALGGDEWRDRYDRLLKQIQKALNQKQAGLEAFQLEAQAAASTQASSK